MLRRRILNRRNVTGVRGNASNLDDLDRLFDTVKREKARSTSCVRAPARAEAVVRQNVVID